MSLVTVEVFLKFELYLQLNLDLHLDSTYLGLGLGIVLGLALARGPTRGVPMFLMSAGKEHGPLDQRKDALCSGGSDEKRSGAWNH